jgi:methionyl-tRNA formyltransferase
MQPWPTAFTYLHREGFEPLRLIVHRASPVASAGRIPGVVFADGGKLWVACGDGASIEIRELQPAGKRRMSATDFLRGNAMPSDARMGGEKLA